MAQTPTQIISLIAPDLAADPNLSGWIELAETRTSRCYFGSDYSLALALRAAHMWALATSRPSGGAGVITSIKEGDLSMSFSAMSGGKSSTKDLQLTSYGQQLLSLIKGLRPAISVLGPKKTITCEE